MRLLFDDITEKDFELLFADDESCMAWLASKKWDKGFVCRKCGHHNHCPGKRPYSRRCTRCKREESATAHTPFHHCRIPLRDAFRMAWLCCHSPAISAAHLSRELDIRQMTCWKFKKKIQQCMNDVG